MQKFAGKSILFMHTGGQFGFFDKVDQLQGLCKNHPVEKFTMNP